MRPQVRTLTAALELQRKFPLHYQPALPWLGTTTREVTFEKMANLWMGERRRLRVLQARGAFSNILRSSLVAHGCDALLLAMFQSALAVLDKPLRTEVYLERP